MCTLSWRVSKEMPIQEVYFSRDEQRSRAKAEPPECRLVNGVSCLFPRDPAGGGTWMGVNEYGVVACLLNDYGVPFEYTGDAVFRSRGLLVTDMLGGASGLTECDALVRETVADAAYAPFRLVVFGGGDYTCWCWDGEELSVLNNVECPVTSSSWDSERVENGRKAIYRDQVIGEGASLDTFHRHQLEGDAESSVCMSREKTQTVSLTRVEVDHEAGVARIWYGARVDELVGDEAFATELGGELDLNIERR